MVQENIRLSSTPHATALTVFPLTILKFKKPKIRCNNLTPIERIRERHLMITIRPNQSLLVEELKSKFENIDRRFDSLFERMNNNGNLNPPPKTVAPDSDSQVICKQISDVLDQWTGRRAQNYFELKHIFQLFNTFSAERYHGNGLNLDLQRAREVLAASKTS